MEKEKTGSSNLPSSSGATISYSSSTPQVSDDNSLSLIGNEFIQIIRTMIREEIQRQAPKTYIGKIIQKVGERYYDVAISGDDRAIVHSLYNGSVEDNFQYGDYVEIMDTENNINTAYILRARGKRYGS